jgi:hypothetical protein
LLGGSIRPRRAFRAFLNYFFEIGYSVVISETAERIERACSPAECNAGNKVVRRMIERKFTIAEILLIAGTRVALGAGIGLLLASQLNNDQRKAAGLALALVGGLTTIPLALGVISKGAEEIRHAA